jgi:hypothetical protein
MPHRLLDGHRRSGMIGSSAMMPTYYKEPKMGNKIWRVPWAEVRHGTEYEEDDINHNNLLAHLLLDGDLGFWQCLINNAPDDPWERYEQGIAIMDDVLVAFDMFGWKVVCKNDPEAHYPTSRSDDFAPVWCGDLGRRSPEELAKLDPKNPNHVAALAHLIALQLRDSRGAS